MLDAARLTASNLPYFYESLDTAFRCIAEAGHQNVEFFAGTPHFFVEPQGHSDCRPVRDLAERYGLRIRALHPETLSGRYGLCVGEPAWRAMSMEWFRRNLEAAAQLGAELVTLEAAGGVLDEPGPAVGERCAEDLRDLAEYAGTLGLTLALAATPQDRPGCAHTLADLSALLQAVDSPRLKALLSLPVMAAAGESIPQWFQCLGPDIAYLHFCDARPGGGRVWGQGVLPLRRLLGQLEAAGYSGLLGLYLEDDSYQEEPARADRENMEALAAAWPGAER